jgi:hypothetical protein
MHAALFCAFALAAGQVARPETAAEELNRRLANPIIVSFDKVPLGDAVDFLRDRYGVPIDIHRKAFQAEFDFKDVATKNVELERVDRVPLGTVLKLLLNQVHGTYRIERDKVVIVPVILR